MINIEKILIGRSIELYDGTPELAKDLVEHARNKTTVFSRSRASTEVAGAKFEEYSALLEAADCMTNVCMLNDHAIKILVAMYPSAPKFVLVRLAPRLSWLLGFFGLLRRVIQGLVRVEGIGKLKKQRGGGNTYWLILEQSGTDVHHIPVIPEGVGIQNFLLWLRRENIKYVVLRFFETLPKLHREAGDLDLLLSDEDKPKVLNYLQSLNAQIKDDGGDVRVGLHSVSGEPGLVPYYPPPIARGMLSRAVSGPANSLVPNPKDALLSLMYHALYHSKKGYASGIPSKLSRHINNHPENDYLGMIKSKALDLKVDVGNSMEEMDEFLAREGWRPKIDTLAKIAETNAWVRDRFFSGVEKRAEGLAVFILREWVVRAGLLDAFVSAILDEGFVVLRTKILNEIDQKYVHDNLRGGTWGVDANGDTELWQPSVAVVILDPECASLPVSYAVGFEQFRIRKLKELLRGKFDNERSSVHSTDNTNEAWEYINVCFVDEVKKIKDEIKTYSQVSIISVFKQLLSPSYLKHSIKHSLRGFIIRKFLTK